jgi:hypothetical protein
MKDNCDFIRGLNKVIGQIREEKVFIDSSIEKVLDDLDGKNRENGELRKVNAALEELNIAIEKEFKDTKADLERKRKHLTRMEGKNKIIK